MSDLDNTLIFTDLANNLAYINAIASVFPDMAVHAHGRLTQDSICQNFAHLTEQQIQKIVFTKQKLFSQYVHLTQPNTPLIALFKQLVEFDTQIILVTHCHTQRAELLLRHFKLETLFSQTLYIPKTNFKYPNAFLSIPQTERPIFIFDDDIVELQQASAQKTTLKNVFLVNNIEKIQCSTDL
ncbi:hypothetical protein [Moraxella caviae]|uniref:hypothetical protein n=1 Tax=Moraxella caviae TaxID=34060 RepID=UPI00117FFD51|nr:hypothetical protein [Moraxella caviae]